MVKPAYLYWNSTGGLVQPNSHGVYINSTRCALNDWVTHESTIFQIIFYVISIPFGMGVLYKYLVKKKESKSKNKYGVDDAKLEKLLNDKEEVGPEAELSQFGYLLPGIIFEAAFGIMYSTWTTRQLTVKDTTIARDARNFLGPFEEIFEFFEDGVMVIVGQAIGASDFMTAGLLMKWALFGGFISGGIGAVMSTIVTFIPIVYGFFIPSNARSFAKSYWIIKSFTWIFYFMSSATSGFFLGTGEIKYFVIATVATTVTKGATFWALINNPNVNHLTTLALVGLLSTATFLLISLLCFARKKYIVIFGLDRNNMFTKEGFKVCKEAAGYGVHLMIRHLVGTIQNSVGFQVAAQLGMGKQYQLLIYNTIVGMYAYSIAPIFLTMGVKLKGAKYLGSGESKKFKKMVTECIIGSILLGLITFALVLVFSKSLPYYYASNKLCEFAQSESTIHTFNDIFRDIDKGMIICAVFCFLGCMIQILESVVYVTMDFEFLRNTTGICFVFVYLPATFISYFVYKSLLGLYISSWLHVVIKVVLYTHRIFFVIIPNIESSVCAPAHKSMRRHSMTVISEYNQDVRNRRCTAIY